MNFTTAPAPVNFPKPPKSRRARKPESVGGFLNVKLEDDRRIEIGVHHQSPRAYEITAWLSATTLFP